MEFLPARKNDWKESSFAYILLAKDLKTIAEIEDRKQNGPTDLSPHLQVFKKN